MTIETTLNRDTERSVAKPAPRRPVVVPSVDIYENAEEYLIVAELPGVEDKDVHVELLKDRLSLRAQNTGDGGVDYARVFWVPETIDAEGIQAKIVDGVLSLHLPKRPELKPRKIEVRAQ